MLTQESQGSVEANNFSAERFSVAEQKFYCLHQLRKRRASVVVSGTLFIEAERVHLSSVLLDTGATEKSYIDPDLVKRFRNRIPSALFRSIRSGVVLGDSFTFFE
jgi:hypothetical protein